MAAPTYGAAGTYYENSSNAPSFGAPASVAANSIVVIATYIDGVTDPGITLPGGFSHAEGSPVYLKTTGSQVGEQNHRLVVAWHRASGSESGPYVITLGSTAYVSGQAHRYDGAITSGTPFDSPTDSDGTIDSMTTTPATTITTAGADRLVLHAATNWGGGTWTAPSGFTKRQQGGFGLCTLADLAQASAGSTGSVTATCSTAEHEQAWLGALIPAGGGGATAIPGQLQPYVARRRAANW